MSEDDREIVAIWNGAEQFIVYKEGLEIGRYVSQARCGRELGIYREGIGKCLRGTRKTAKGYTFKFYNSLEGREL